ncbi:hypothetical protein BB560_006718 [Smittium megazygosporum]|uniref:mRNA 3'-end-processing protein n=1 Tax=Smittium megazygosporum TaxID=133381 RepID=A0A2T9Y294_9FUNG|nr:hypothetical protein BB560_006718 [Smittium megazygosporum]
MADKPLCIIDPSVAQDKLWFDFEPFIKENLLLTTVNPNDPASSSLNQSATATNQSVQRKPNEQSGVCNFFLKGHCYKGNNCQYRHISQAAYNSEKLAQSQHSVDKTVVCKHWLRGLCKKGDNCEFLHEYNLTKMPACWFFVKYGECGNGDECVYQHIDPDSIIKECLWYNRGFCKNGPHCKRKHKRKILCKNFLFGFCPLGSNCILSQ